MAMGSSWLHTHGLSGGHRSTPPRLLQPLWVQMADDATSFVPWVSWEHVLVVNKRELVCISTIYTKHIYIYIYVKREREREGEQNTWYPWSIERLLAHLLYLLRKEYWQKTNHSFKGYYMILPALYYLIFHGALIYNIVDLLLSWY